MAAGQVARVPRQQVGVIRLLLVIGVFVAGSLLGIGVGWVAHSPALSVRTFALSPTLDTGKPYLTVQGGVVVPPASQ